MHLWVAIYQIRSPPGNHHQRSPRHHPRLHGHRRPMITRTHYLKCNNLQENQWLATSPVTSSVSRLMDKYIFALDSMTKYKQRNIVLLRKRITSIHIPSISYYIIEKRARSNLRRTSWKNVSSSCSSSETSVSSSIVSSFLLVFWFIAALRAYQFNMQIFVDISISSCVIAWSKWYIDFKMYRDCNRRRNDNLLQNNYNLR